VWATLLTVLFAAREDDPVRRDGFTFVYSHQVAHLESAQRQSFAPCDFLALWGAPYLNGFPDDVLLFKVPQHHHRLGVHGAVGQPLFLLGDSSVRK
jgi:hypothetical protein